MLIVLEEADMKHWRVLAISTHITLRLMRLEFKTAIDTADDKWTVQDRFEWAV